MNHASYMSFYQLSKTEINKFLHLSGWKFGDKILSAKEKSKGDWVTLFDLKISQIIEKVITDMHLPHYLLSEETWNQSQKIDFNQSLMILDPIDGTHGFINGTKYFALSLAIMEQGELISSWVWNFGTHEEMISEMSSAASRTLTFEQTKPLSGLVSESEWRKNLWQSLHDNVDLKEKIHLTPCGSIAYKLLLLAMGQCHFVASQRPKNIWDIAGGTQLLSAKGFKLYCNNTEVLKLDHLLWQAPLLWCLPKDKDFLSQILFSSIGTK